MPEIARFYGGEMALIDIHALAAFAGRLPPRALGLVIEWASMHQTELMELWVRARNNEPLDRIDPLP